MQEHESVPADANPLVDHSYTYDPATTPGVDQLTSVTEGGATRSFTYNTDGDTTSYGDKTLTWDGWGRHSGGTFAGQSVSYEFDPTGFRRKRTSGTSVTRYLHGGLYESDDAGTITLTDVDGPAGDLARYTGPPTTSTPVTYLYYNGHGDLAAEADTSGTRTNTYTYDPYGAPLQTLPTNATAERWTGRWDKKLDTTSSLIEMGVRPYDAVLGRFLAVDPVEGGSCSAYDYACQDPVNVYDLDGRCPWCIVIARVASPLIARGGAAATTAYRAYRLGKRLRKLSDSRFTEALYRLEARSRARGGTHLDPRATQVFLKEARRRGWYAPRGVETGAWRGGPHINLMRIGQGTRPQRVHLPVPRGFKQ